MSEVYFEVESLLDEVVAGGDEAPSELVPRAQAMSCLRGTIKRATLRLLAAPSEAKAEEAAEGE